MRSLFVVVALAATVASAGERQKLLVLDISVSAPELKGTASNLVEQLLTELSKSDRFEVIGSSDVSLLLGMERQRQLLGCGESSASCLAEIGGALGAPWLISGALSRAGLVYRLDLKLIDTQQARALNRVGRTVDSQEELFRLVPALADELVAPIPAAPGSSVNVGRVLPWVTLGVGVVAAGAGVGLLVVSGNQARALEADKPNLYWADLQKQAAGVQGTYWAGVALTGVGAALVAGGLAWAWFTREPPKVQVTLGPGFVSIGGSL